MIRTLEHPHCPIHGVSLVGLVGPYGRYWKCTQNNYYDSGNGKDSRRTIVLACDITASRSKVDKCYYISNHEEREWKKRAHAAFDDLWQRAVIARGVCYLKLAAYLGISKRDCHIQHFDLEQCKKVIDFVAIVERDALNESRDVSRIAGC